MIAAIALLEQSSETLDSSLIMPDFDLTGELSLKIELAHAQIITEKVHSGNGAVSLVCTTYNALAGAES